MNALLLLLLILHFRRH